MYLTMFADFHVVNCLMIVCVNLTKIRAVCCRDNCWSSYKACMDIIMITSGQKILTRGHFAGRDFSLRKFNVTPASMADQSEC